MNLSIIIPLYNESESLPELVAWIKKVVDLRGLSYELILIDDGSKDSSWNVIEELKKENLNIVGIKFRRNYGKSAALNVGFEVAKGEVVATMDADLQDSPDEIPALYNRMIQENYDLISGWKQQRHDPLSKTIPTKLFNAVTRWVSGISQLHDFNCGLKVYRQEVIKTIEVYGEMHRYIPVLAKWAGFTKIAEQVVVHYPRKYGTSKFGFNRFVNGFLDLLSIFFVGKFSKKPMHFFGTMGVLSLLAGFILSSWIIADKLISIAQGEKYRHVTDQPLFYIALVAIVIGFQLFLTGFLAELISRNGSERNVYQVEKRI